MKILVTGAAGFAGRNLVENLKNIRDGKNRTRPLVRVEEVFEYDLGNTQEELDRFCADCDFVFNLAGVNRPQDPAEFREGNFGFASVLLETLKKHGNKCPVMLSSSQQASLAGRFGTSAYGLSKRDGEELFFAYGKENGVPVYVYRFPNLAGKWIRPNYNSAVATFCHNIARDLPVTVNDPAVELELLFIDDLLEEMYDALEGHPHRCDYPQAGEVIDGKEYDGLTPLWREDGRYCAAEVTHKATLGEIVSFLNICHDEPRTLRMPEMREGSFEKKLYSMYLSYLPEEKAVYDLKMNADARGCFTELLKSDTCGQFSVNVLKPGMIKGQHWHNSKWELFIVVSGHGLIQQRKVGTDKVTEFEVSGEKLQTVQTIPGHTHNIINLSDREDLVVLIWSNEVFDPDHPDTFAEKV